MKEIKKAGIWMDHASAHTLEYTDDARKLQTLESEFTKQDKEEVLTKGESHMHNKEQNKHAVFYKKLASIILNYDNVLLFGPTNAKSELHNILKADHRFEKIKFELKQSEKMTTHEMEAFVRNHYSAG